MNTSRSVGDGRACENVALHGASRGKSGSSAGAPVDVVGVGAAREDHIPVCRGRQRSGHAEDEDGVGLAARV